MKELEIFTNYYSKFDSSVDAISSKYEHTFRVVNYAKEIATSLNLSESDIALAKICALFHDIGRFPQYEEYNTFRDAISFDHGDKGYEILKSLGYTNEIVLAAVKYHNKYKVPEILDDRTKMFCNIVRDADKLDIMVTQCNKCNSTTYDVPESVLNSFKNHKLIDNKVCDVKSDIIDILRCVAFIFDINYPRTFELVEAYAVVNKKCDLLYNKFNKSEILEIKSECNNFIMEHVR